MKEGTYITIQSWMRNKLELKGNDLLVYALIHGFCQDGESKFTGSISYISNWLGISKSTVQEILSKLVKSGRLIKYEIFENTIKYCKYSTVGIPEIGMGYTGNRYGGIPEIGTEGIPEIGTNNNTYNNKDIITWRNDYNIYKSQLRETYLSLINNHEWIEQQEKYHPGIDIELTLEKACVNYWATEAGWKYKKAKKTENIDWKSTLTKSLSQSINKVYKQKR